MDGLAVQAASKTLFIPYQLWCRVQLRPSVRFVLVIMYGKIWNKEF